MTSWSSGAEQAIRSITTYNQNAAVADSHHERPMTSAPGRAEPEQTTAELQARFDAVFDDWSRTETDPEVLLECPAIRDTEVPTTASFHDALGAAQRRLTEATVSTLESAWKMAIDTAFEIGLRGLSTAEKRRAEKAWDTAKAPAGVTDAERRAARDQVIDYLDRVIVTVADDNDQDSEPQCLNGARVLDDHLAHAAIPAPARLALTAVSDSTPACSTEHTTAPTTEN